MSNKGRNSRHDRQEQQTSEYKQTSKYSRVPFTMYIPRKSNMGLLRRKIISVLNTYPQKWKGWKSVLYLNFSPDSHIHVQLAVLMAHACLSVDRGAGLTGCQSSLILEHHFEVGLMIMKQQNNAGILWSTCIVISYT